MKFSILSFWHIQNKHIQMYHWAKFQISFIIIYWDIRLWKTTECPKIAIIEISGFTKCKSSRFASATTTTQRNLKRHIRILTVFNIIKGKNINKYNSISSHWWKFLSLLMEYSNKLYKIYVNSSKATLHSLTIVPYLTKYVGCIIHSRRESRAEHETMVQS